MIKNFKLINSCLEDKVIKYESKSDIKLKDINWDSLSIALFISNFNNKDIDIEKLTLCNNLGDLDSFITNLID